MKTIHGDVGLRKPLKKRPNSVTILALYVFIIATINLIRIAQVVRQWHFLTAVLSYIPVYQLVTGIIWGLYGLALFWGIWRGWRKTPIFVITGAIFYSIYLWIDRLAITASSFDSNWLFMLIINILILTFIIWSLTRRNTKTFFGEANDTRSQD